MKYDELARWSTRVGEWAEQYHKGLRDQPVRAQTQPGEIRAALPKAPPEEAIPFEAIMSDFEKQIVPGLTHWQHPRFFAYFPSNAAPASMIAEHLANVISAQCMIWQTCPAATELEQVVVDWLRQALALPEGFVGFIHDTATVATLSAILTMRERVLEYRGLQAGLSQMPRLRIYASAHTHSSIDKGVRIAGIGQENLVKVATDESESIDANALRAAIQQDLAAGYVPAGVILATGGTSIGAFDKLGPALEVCRAFELYTHVDAAWAGSAMICPEFRHHWQGVEGADSIVFNPHKWLGAQFDCAVQFLKRPEEQVRTLGLRPDYLQTLGQSEITNFNEWTVPLGRRFRALKLWFLLRAYGLSGLRERISNHVAWAKELALAIGKLPGFQIVTEPRLSLFSFQLAPEGADANALTAELLQRVNDDGRTYLTQTSHRGAFVIRFQAGQFDCTREDVMAVADILRELAAPLLAVTKGGGES